jgi:thiamine biosynthesis protein ThiS
MSVQIALNGERHELPAPVSVSALLETLGLDPRLVAVELNRVVVKRERYGTTTVGAGAEVEIVAFVGGGASGTGQLTERGERPQPVARRCGPIES